MTDLNSLVNSGSAATLAVANGINNSGQIVGFDIPEPSSVVLAAFGLAGLAVVWIHRRRCRQA